MTTLYMLHKPKEVQQVGLTMEALVEELSKMPGVPAMSGLPDRLESARAGEWLEFPSLPGVLVMPYEPDPTVVPDVRERHTVTVTKVDHTIPEVVMKHPETADQPMIATEAVNMAVDRTKRK